MLSLRQIRRRIRTVDNIHDVTRAMEMVAASRYKRAESRLKELKPYLDNLEALGGRLINFSAYKHPLAKERVSGKSALIIITSERGLCGAYNTNLFKAAHEYLDGKKKNPQLMIVGRKGDDYFRRRRYDVISKFANSGLKFDLALAKSILDECIKLFLENKIDEIDILYSDFASGGNVKPMIERFLPISPEALKNCIEYIYEPDEARVQDAIIPVYLAYKLYAVLLSAITSEYMSRMVSMKAATDNAEEMTGSLTLLRNKIRQASITREIMEITSGAEALK